MPRLPPAVLSAAFGVCLALCGLPLAWSALTVFPLALLLGHLSRQPSVKQLTLQTLIAISAFFAAQLFWLVVFMQDLMSKDGSLPLVLAWPLSALTLSLLFVLEGIFWALMAFLVAAAFKTPQGRLWGLAGGWVILEWLRTLGALAFPWSGLGYTFLRTPLIQVADLGGVLLLTALLTASAAALVTLMRVKNPRPAALMAALWLAALGYGLTRTAGEGPPAKALLLRTNLDSFAKVTGQDFDQQWQAQLQLSQQRRAGEVTVWSETALLYPERIGEVPAPGLYGMYQYPRNTAIGWDGQRITGSFDKAHPVPMGEYFPLSGALNGLYSSIYQSLNLGSFNPQFPGQSYAPIPLGRVLYGVYICYDSIVAHVARQMALQGAQVLVNVSNDGWYTGWGVWQHFDMGRVRAIETRRYVLRSVNKGVAAVINDLGEPVQTLTEGEGVLHAEYPLLSATTLYMRLGDVPALIAALLLLGYALRLDCRRTQ
ncbi:apolipoprotein N-acyltransferase [Deinococcus psychrotolerans]|uniref:Apolipoprotein N-acyltransferase n=1 Tax=Deinococcus psychrotolerans TaxID=2489213 RepID=A0A3G8YL33_9DEIO|nr:apolipoprotein N-acyltransferase [Deinococcus psychrotolerans]AZI41796.1 apolipoprotein N-acyltransferase [Deinococcus psychrotolerans]